MSFRGLGWSAGGTVVSVLLVAMGWGLLHASNPAQRSIVGRPAPPLAIRALDGRSVRLSDFGGKPLVLNFWASLCGPCKQEDPAFRQAAADHAGSVQFQGVDINDTPAGAQAYEDTAPHPYPVGPPFLGCPADYGVTGPPETFFIDARGLVVASFVGPLDGPTLNRYLKLVGAG